jgi:excisionase family DNA binding protein
MSESTEPLAKALDPADAASADDYCGTSQAARLLGLSVATVQALVEKGELQAWKTQGGHRRIAMASVNRLLQQQGARSPAGKLALPHRLRVMVVEDDESLRMLYRAQFEAWDLPMDFTLMDSALEAMMAVSNLAPDLLITDLAMPGVDGFEMLRVLRANPQLHQMHVLVVSGMAPEAIAQRGGLPDDARLLTKPVSFDWLNGYISALIATRRTPA